MVNNDEIPTVTFKHRNLPALLLQAREALMMRYRPELRKHGLTDQQWRVLRALSRTDEMDTGRLAKETSISSPSLTGVLTRMSTSKLIERHADPLDKRRTQVRATNKGQTVVKNLTSAIEVQYEMLEYHLSKHRLAQLYGLLDSIVTLETLNHRYPSHTSPTLIKPTP